METQRKEGKKQTWNETDGAMIEIYPQPVYMPGSEYSDNINR